MVTGVDVECLLDDNLAGVRGVQAVIGLPSHLVLVLSWNIVVGGWRRAQRKPIKGALQVDIDVSIDNKGSQEDGHAPTVSEGVAERRPLGADPTPVTTDGAIGI